jgi:hypothetical protein
MTITTYDSYRSRYFEEYTPSPEELPADHWTKRLPPEPVKPTTHDLQIAHCIVEYGAKPKRDMAKITAYLKLRAERARRAKAAQASPTGPRPDEWVGKEKPLAVTQGAVNPEATGPVGAAWKAPVGGRWVAGLNGVERFVPDPAPAFTPVPKPVPVPVSVKPEEVQGTLTGTSAIGMKTRPNCAPACGPTPVEWVDPTAKK